jgi:hypothetical protein
MLATTCKRGTIGGTIEERDFLTVLALSFGVPIARLAQTNTPVQGAPAGIL